ncbi:MAG: hypothetical protein LBQ52_00500 [Helicobacteraceae bacterium]|jgi:hypothetical protein|nr:hypothetical protein [Helicobacteraceae bacterium]
MGGAVLDFKYEANGTVEVTADMGGGAQTFTGAYVVKDGVQATYLDFEGTAGYVYNVIDNNSIAVTEIDSVSEADGSFTLGNTSIFRRKNSVVRENVELPTNLTQNGDALDAIFGAWSGTMSEPFGAGFVEFKVIYSFEKNGVFAFLATEITPPIAPTPMYGTGVYSVIDNVILTLSDGEFGATQFTMKGDGNMTVATIVGVDENGRILYPNPPEEFEFTPLEF